MKPPPRLFALIVNDQFSPLRVFPSRGTAYNHKLKHVERWRLHDPQVSDSWLDAKVIQYRRAK